jgi:hypothetical protein
MAALAGCAEGPVGPDGEPGEQGPAGPQGAAGEQGPAGPPLGTTVTTCPKEAEYPDRVDLVELGGLHRCIFKGTIGDYVPAAGTWYQGVDFCAAVGYQGLCSVSQLTQACRRGYSLGAAPQYGYWLADRGDRDDYHQWAAHTKVGGVPLVCDEFEDLAGARLETRDFICCADYPIYPSS